MGLRPDPSERSSQLPQEEAAARTEVSVDQAVQVLVPEELAEIVGAVLMEAWGPFEYASSTGQGVGFQMGGAAPGTKDEGRPLDDRVVLTFYPSAEAVLSLGEALDMLPESARVPGVIELRTVEVPRDWVEGWKAHFRPTVVGAVGIRPPWAEAEAAPVQVVINPGLGFGTGLHPTTRGTLLLLQSSSLPGCKLAPEEGGGTGGLGPLVDAGTGSGILAIAAAKLGWGPVIAFDNDPQALVSARQNVHANQVEEIVSVREMDVLAAPLDWFAGATVLANMTLGPVLVLVKRLAEGLEEERRPRRLVVSGILAGEQEQALLETAWPRGFACSERVYEEEWVTLELVPVSGGELPCTVPGSW